MNAEPKNVASRKPPTRRSLCASPGAAISCAATNPDQWLTLYADGRVRVHTRNLDTAGTRPYRTLDYRPRLKSDSEAIRRLIWHLNLVAAGSEGIECQVCDCYSPLPAGTPDAWRESAYASLKLSLELVLELKCYCRSEEHVTQQREIELLIARMESQASAGNDRIKLTYDHRANDSRLQRNRQRGGH